MQQRRVVAWLVQHNFPHGLVSFVEGLSTGPLQHKTDYLRKLQNEAEIIYHAAYGSAKDISVYSALGIAPEKIFIAGKVAKKLQSQATVSTVIMLLLPLLTSTIKFIGNVSLIT